MGTLNVITSATETAEANGCAVKLESGIWQPGSAIWEKDANNEWIQRWAATGEWEVVREWNLADSMYPDQFNVQQHSNTSQYGPGNLMWFRTHDRNNNSTIRTIDVGTGIQVERFGKKPNSGIVGASNKRYFYIDGVLHLWDNTRLYTVPGIRTDLMDSQLYEGYGYSAGVYFLAERRKNIMYRVKNTQATVISTSLGLVADIPNPSKMLVSPDGNIMYWFSMSYTETKAINQPFRYYNGVLQKGYGNLMEVTGVMDEPLNVPARHFGKVTNEDEVRCLRIRFSRIDNKYHHQWLHKEPGTDQFTCTPLPNVDEKIDPMITGFFELANGKCVWLGMVGGNSTTNRRGVSYVSDGPLGELKELKIEMPNLWTWVTWCQMGSNKVSAIIADNLIGKDQTKYRLVTLEL